MYRAFYAIRSLSNSSGIPTNAIFGFTKILQKFLKEKNPNYLVIAFDPKGPTFRHSQYEEYKAHRKPMPDELIGQISKIKAIVEGYRIPMLEIPGFEADDAIASLAERMKKDFDVFIVSPDKDILQMIQPGIRVIPNPSDEKILDENAVIENFGVPPRKIRDLLALMGDASDNIPGIPKIGPKSAAALLEEFDSVEEIFQKAWIQTKKGKILKENLLKHEQDAFLSKKLATLCLDCPIDFSLESAQIQLPDKEKLAKLFQEFEFKDLLREVLPIQTQTVEIKKKKVSLHKFMNEAAREIGLSLQAEGEHALEAKLTGIALASATQETFVSFPLQPSETSELKALLADTKILKAGYNLKRAKLVLSASGIELKGPLFDVMIAAFLVNPAIRLKSLQDICLHFQQKNIASDELFVNEDCLHKEAEAVLSLEPILKNLLLESKQYELFKNMEIPLLEVLSVMEKNGIPLNIKKLEQLSKEFHQIVNEQEEKIFALAGEKFNIQSPKELSRILFEKLKLPAGRKTKTGYSTDAEVLKELAPQHAIVACILEYRQAAKLTSTYVDALPRMVLAKTGRLHTTFSQTTAETGRLASLNPNLQNIPIRSILGIKIREAFVAPDSDSVLLSADYSQIELRILAHFSEDEGLLAAFEKDEDIHRWTAQKILGVSGSEVSDNDRSRAKAINFGIVYGMGAFGLSRELNISVEEAQNFMKTYHERFPKVKAFIDSLLEKARNQGFVTTLYQRRRYLPDLKSPQVQLRQMAERMAMNTPIQGTSADLIKLAMIRIQKDIEEQDLASQQVLQIHDELIFIVPKKELDLMQKLVKDRMENIAPLKVKLKVNMNAGENWMVL